VPCKFLFVSLDGLIGDIAWEVTREGHEARYFIGNEEERGIADGFVEKSLDWRADVDWADVIVFDDVLGQGTEAQRLRQQGKLVVGGSPYSDRLEDDRAFGQQELRAAGVPIIPQRDFKSFDDAIEFVRANPQRYVIKPSGEAQNMKGLLFVGEEEDGRDVLQVLDDYKRAWSDRIHDSSCRNGSRASKSPPARSSTGASSCRRCASTSSTRSCFQATSDRRRARWARRCSGASRTASSTRR
jgi:phosphoribosylamine--glycine ligase